MANSNSDHLFDRTCSQSAAGHLVLAKSLLESGNLATAVEQLDLAIESSPRFALSHFWKGVVLFLLARFVDSRSCLETALQIDPQLVNGWLALAHVQYEQSEFATALASVDRALAVDAKNPRAHMMRAGIELALGNREEAMKSDAQALHLSPVLGQARLRRASLLLQSGQESEAIEQILIALRMQGTDVNTRLCLANLLHCVGRTDEAIAELHVTSEMFPKSPHALVRLAQIHVSRDDEFAAEKALRQALLRVPKHIECEMMLGHIQLKRGMDAEAAACANRVLAIDSQMFEAHQLLKAAQPAPAQPAAGPAT